MNRVRGIKNLIWISIVAMLVMAMGVGVGTSSPGPAWIKVDPWLYGTENAGDVGDTFDISVKAHDVENLFLAEFWLRHDPSVLQVVDDPATPLDIEGINPDDQPNSLEEIYYEDVTDGIWADTVEFAVGQQIGVLIGLNGTVGLAKITYQIVGEGETVLKLYWSKLIDIDGKHISHYAQDGLYTNVHPTLNLKKLQPDWSSGAVGTGNTLYAKVTNDGNEDALVRVKFTVRGPVLDETVDSAWTLIAAGDYEWIPAPYTPSVPGTYKVTGAIYYGVSWYIEGQLIDQIAWEVIEYAFGGEGTSKVVPGLGPGAFRAE